jgi:hypothetical protein
MLRYLSLKRASHFAFSDQITLKTCSVEVLVVMKAFANREHDWLDVESVVIRQGEGLDWQTIDDELQPLETLREDENIVARL